MKKAAWVLWGLPLVLILIGTGGYASIVSRPFTAVEPEHPFHPTQFNRLRFAHRGGYAFGPENTLETIVENIRERQINALEIDVQITRDGTLILFHDETTGRLLDADADRPITELTAAEVLALPLRDTTRGRVHPPLFSDVVDMLTTLIRDEDRRFMIELDFKPHGDDTERAVASLVEIIEAQEAELGEQIYDYFFVSSFYPSVLAEIRRHSDSIVTALGVNSDPPTNVMAARAVIKAAHFIMKKNDVRILEPNHCLLTGDFSDTWAERGILINTYTVNTACEKDYVTAFPVAYTTNCPGETCQPDASDLVLEKRNWCALCD